MQIDILTLFPKLCEGALAESMMKRAQEKGLATLRVHNIRDWATGKHLVADDTPYGGGQGMVMKCEPIFAAVEALRTPETRVVLMTPAGRPFRQELAAHYALAPHLIILCGHYEGIDQRVIDHLVDDEISIGDYVLTNGAIAALVVTDAIVRLISWNTPTTPGPWSSGGGRCRMSCSAATTPRSPNGGGRKPWKKRKKTGPTSSLKGPRKTPRTLTTPILAFTCDSPTGKQDWV